MGTRIFCSIFASLLHPLPVPFARFLKRIPAAVPLGWNRSRKSAHSCRHGLPRMPNLCYNLMNTMASDWGMCGFCSPSNQHVIRCWYLMHSNGQEAKQMRDFWSQYVQTTGELYRSRSLRFHDGNKELWLRAIGAKCGDHVLEVGCAGGAFCHRLLQYLSLIHI